MTTDGRRWDTDVRGHGEGDASAAVPAVSRLVEAMLQDGWVAEDPELHLLPHLEGAAETLGVDIRGSRTVEGAYELELGRDDRSGGEMRTVTLALVSTIAEASTHVRQVAESEFEIVTGMLPGDSPMFAAHGHVLRIRFV